MEFQTFDIYTDGAAIGNPGLTSIGAVIYGGTKIVMEISKCIGFGTVNEAEYKAVIEALKALDGLNPNCVNVYSDSQIVVYQLNGRYKVKTENLIILHDEVKAIIASMNSSAVNFVWINRKENSIADALAMEALGMNQAEKKKSGYIFWNTNDFKVPKATSKGILGLPDINLACKNNIGQINFLNENAKFKDFMGLKTNGIDDYSKMDENLLTEAIQIRFGKKTLNHVIKTLEKTNAAYKKDVLRWTARGLYPNLSMKKASVNAETKAKNEGN